APFNRTQVEGSKRQTIRFVQPNREQFWTMPVVPCCFFSSLKTLLMPRDALSSAPPRRFIPAPSFVAQRHHGVDARPAPCGYKGRKQGHSAEQDRNARKGQHVGACYAEE